MKHLFYVLVVLSLNLPAASPSFAQCDLQVMHTSGRRVIGGIGVTVTSEGVTDSVTSYCDIIPYLIGSSANSDTCGTGRYNFIFSPPASGIVLNFGGISHARGSNEVVVLRVNGQHFAIPTVGKYNYCDEGRATLTPTGDIGAYEGCEVCGWNGTTIQGPVSSLTVIDTNLAGLGGGSLLSVFLCSSMPDDPIVPAVSLGPQPFYSTLEVTLARYEPATIALYNDLAQLILLRSFAGTTRLATDYLARGVYFYHVYNEHNVLATGKILHL